MNHLSRALFVAAGAVALASQAHAQATLVSQDRKVDVGASYTGIGTPNESPSTLTNSPSPGLFSQTISISTPSGVATGIAKQTTTIGTTHMFGTGSATALAQEKPNANGSISARGLSSFSSNFSLTTATQISLDASIPNVTQSKLGGNIVRAAYIDLVNSTTNQTLASVFALRGSDGNYTIGAPVHFQATLPAGSYTLSATAEMRGSSTVGPNGSWTGTSSFQFDLWIPSPGAAGLLLTALFPMAARRRR